MDSEKKKKAREEFLAWAESLGDPGGGALAAGPVRVDPAFVVGSPPAKRETRAEPTRRQTPATKTLPKRRAKDASSKTASAKRNAGPGAAAKKKTAAKSTRSRRPID